ncbi:putative Rrp15p [Trypanosoma vivax]|uniref:Rrp15p n=1 Tax=Trypanosoma vivax (strain Y486) TaxID=1055687 RepID=G0TW64_TRYVY|nr:hypothetical protein TRVL_00279 [Trypanosoma vivax]KAH8606831.1 putative Rrp15p [Trypanosoma vivax]CCC48180.1 conserved hypothetical protein [Trypanosoma vivax Y486]
MAGPFRGAVGKLTKPKKSRAAKRAKGKRTVALVKRAPKLSPEALQQRIAELTGAAVSGPLVDVADETKQVERKRSKNKVASSSQAANVIKKPVGKGAIEIVGKRTEKVVPTKDVAMVRSPAEAMGLKLLHRAVKNQSHNRSLPHQGAHDYEYRLRTIATAGVVCLFNSLAQSRKAGNAVEAQESHMTADKVHEKKQIASKEAFLASLRQPRRMERY